MFWQFSPWIDSDSPAVLYPSLPDKMNTKKIRENAHMYFIL